MADNRETASSFERATEVDFEEVLRSRRELLEAHERERATAEILGVISRSAADVQPVFDAIVKSTAKLFAPWSANISILKDGFFYFIASASASREDAELTLKRGAAVYPIAFDPDRSPSARALLERRIIEFLDTAAPETPESSRKVGAATGFRSMTFVPLFLKEEGIGTIILTHREPGRSFTAKQHELIQTFANQAVIAIENARLFRELKTRTEELQGSLDQLRTAQDRLVQTEKLTFLGQLTAGIAHEIQNPLNFVNNFTALSDGLLGDLQVLLFSASLDQTLQEDVNELAGMLKSNLQKVLQHGRRADSIVKNMLLHSRAGVSERRRANINAIVEEAMNLAYHGARAEKAGFNVTIEKKLDPEAGDADLYPQEFTRVLLNLISNAFYAVSRRKAEGGDPAFEPTVAAVTRARAGEVEIRIRDNGVGIPAEVRDQIFNPFFTTKPPGEGTGLGLSLSFDIVVKQHGGTITVDTAPNVFTEFIITLPRGAAGRG